MIIINNTFYFSICCKPTKTAATILHNSHLFSKEILFNSIFYGLERISLNQHELSFIFGIFEEIHLNNRLYCGHKVLSYSRSCIVSSRIQVISIK